MVLFLKTTHMLICVAAAAHCEAGGLDGPNMLTIWLYGKILVLNDRLLSER